MIYTTPLRYPGGKAVLAPYIMRVLEQNQLLDGHYVEVYAGGAGIAFPLLFQRYVSAVHLNDLNQSVYSFWRSVLIETDELCRLIHDRPVNMEEWQRQKSIQRDPQNHTSLELGFSTFFLNRTNRSGIIQAGVIGGKNQTGKWKIDARYNKPDLITRIKKIAAFRSRIFIYNLDAVDMIQGVIPSIQQKSLIYLDPPYYVKGEGLYENHYKHEDHAKIALLVQKTVKQPWIVSYDSAPQIQSLYAKRRKVVYGLNYSAQDRYEGSETIFFSDALDVPDVKNPAKINAA